MDKAQSLRMNFWTPTDSERSKGLELTPEDLPWYVLFDYVEVFTWDEASNEFRLHWRDDFDTLDNGRWHIAEGGFEENSCEFKKDNVYSAHGYLVLKMDLDKEERKRLKNLKESGQSNQMLH